MRQANIQEILMTMVHDLTMKQAKQIKVADPSIARNHIVSKMVQNAYDVAPKEVTADIMALNYDETVYLELQLQHFALKGLQWLEKWETETA